MGGAVNRFKRNSKFSMSHFVTSRDIDLYMEAGTYIVVHGYARFDIGARVSDVSSYWSSSIKVSSAV